MHRRRFLLSFAAMSGTTLLAGCGKRRPRLPRVESGQTILAFGDSLTFGTGAQPGEAYPAVLEKLIGRKVVSEGIPGESTPHGTRAIA